jgi:hypothetical protein
VESNDEKQQGIREVFTDSRSGSVFNVLIMREERKYARNTLLLDSDSYLNLTVL